MLCFAADVCKDVTRLKISHIDFSHEVKTAKDLESREEPYFLNGVRNTQKVSKGVRNTQEVLKK